MALFSTSRPKTRAAPSLCAFLLVILHLADALGGEKIFFTTPLGASNVSHRQNVCDRFFAFYDDRLELRRALEGLQLHVFIGNYQGAYFNYDPENGIDKSEPGLIPVILDEVGRRGGFTWRNSFGIYTDPSAHNMTWDETLHWGIDSYDIVADWWAHSLDRMNNGVVFIEAFLDSSMIMVTRDVFQAQSSSDVTISSFFNWLKPYDAAVWAVTLFTIFLSGIVYQILEWYADEREDRGMWEWWLENVYLSFMNSTQAYEYQPKTLASRIFGISMAIWALVMTATYTANLASLLVDRQIQGPQTLDEVVVGGKKMCVWEDTYIDFHLQDNYRKAVRIPKHSELEQFEGLLNGECEYMLTSYATWSKFKGIREYNKKCDMYLVGGKEKELGSGFALTADSGKLCTGLIRDVLDLHMRDIIEEGFLARAWANEFERTKTIDCLTYKPEIKEAQDEEGARKRQLRQGHDNFHPQLLALVVALLKEDIEHSRLAEKLLLVDLLRLWAILPMKMHKSLLWSR
ncbi:receptor ionotropic, delta-2 [Seminavis robusta]|uniref:Receptor ionotropic, delta-2 n=1 Tax=Seminavis robusta TaxID=568900 RepID=A0A9N8HFL0_9STRA|nr:receptor ionotropic, delta-2 [Seminavis robusta]|eukprot:Sro577_g169740.1 receptor ionotropic, delta-2 (516) ;mRNA; r:54006-55703